MDPITASNHILVKFQVLCSYKGVKGSPDQFNHCRGDVGGVDHRVRKSLGGVFMSRWKGDDSERDNANVSCDCMQKVARYFISPHQ